MPLLKVVVSSTQIATDSESPCEEVVDNLISSSSTLESAKDDQEPDSQQSNPLQVEWFCQTA